LAVGKSSEGFQALQQSAPGASAASTSAQASAADSSKVLIPASTLIVVHLRVRIS